MSREYVYLSFFKTNKIDYIYHSQLQRIEFSCIHCQNSTLMCSESSEWNCTFCNHSGNIISLIKYATSNSFGRIYVPKKEQQSILQLLDRIAKKYPEEKRLLKVKGKINDLVKYYEKNTV